MQTQESIMALMKEQFEVLKILRPRAILCHLDIAKTVHDCLYNYIVDIATSPRSVLDLLKVLERLSWYNDRQIQFNEFVYATCLESIAMRRPEALEGSWEELIWHIIYYMGGFFSMEKYETKGIISFKYFKEWIPIYCALEVCPNPCLRLELFSFMEVYDIADNGTCKEDFIITLFELHDRFSILQMKDIVETSPLNVKSLLQKYVLDIGSILNSEYPKAKKERFIEAVIKITKMFSRLEEVREQNNERSDSELITNLMDGCLHFYGLIPDLESKVDMENFAEFVSSKNLLQVYVADILGTVNTNISAIYRGFITKDTKINSIMNALVTSEARLRTRQLPPSLLARELKGLTPRIVHQMTYFTSIYMNKDSINPLTRNRIFYSEYDDLSDNSYSSNDELD